MILFTINMWYSTFKKENKEKPIAFLYNENMILFMSSTQTKQFIERKTRVKQALKSEKFAWIENYQGISTVKRLMEQTGLNEQAIKRILKNLQKEGAVEVKADKSHIVLLK